MSTQSDSVLSRRYKRKPVDGISDKEYRFNLAFPRRRGLRHD
jgi:hypothetical protein